MKLYKTMFIIALISLVYSLEARAEENDTITEITIVEHLNQTPGVTIIQPDGLMDRLKKTINNNTTQGNEQGTQKPGTKNTATTKDVKKDNKAQKPGSFAVEVFSDNSKNAREAATQRQRAVQQRFGQYHVTLRFDSPFWRVRVGNFRTREDAENAMSNIRRAFPSYSSYMRIIGH